MVFSWRNAKWKFLSPFLRSHCPIEILLKAILAVNDEKCHFHLTWSFSKNMFCHRKTSNVFIYSLFLSFSKKRFFWQKMAKFFFAANTLNIMNSSPLVNSPRIVLSISAFNLRKKNRRRNPIYGFWSKNFFHRNS